MNISSKRVYFIPLVECWQELIKMIKKDARVHTQYPCPWLFKVIGPDQDKVRSAISEAVQDSSNTVSYSNVSKTGKYHCLNLELVVHSKENRNAIYQALKTHPDIVMVL